MALYNVDTSNNTLLATAHVANCSSEIVSQDAADTDFESIRETRAHWRLNNISGATSSADLLYSTSPLDLGDRIFIIKDDNSIYDTTVTNISINTTPINPIMTSNTLPAGVAKASTGASDAWKLFDGDTGTRLSDTSWENGEWVEYQFDQNTPFEILKFYIKLGFDDDSSAYWFSFNIEGSLDGTNYSTISTHPLANYGAGVTLDIESPGSFSYYRLKLTSVSNYKKYLYEFALLDPTGNTVDTSSITAGEIPSKVFRFEDTVQFNGLGPALQKDVFYEYGTTGAKLAITSLYNDYLLNGRELVTRVDFSATGNEVVEISGQIYKVI